jgi:hypothetical protein
MKENSIRTRALQCAFACICLACGTDEQPIDAAAEAAPSEVAVADDSVYVPQRELVEKPDRIYLSLTAYEWYARGEPLLHANAAYQPAGFPVAAPLSEMHVTGEYQGVEYYVRDGDAEPILYVPVYEGYWQAFRPDTAGRSN